MQNRNGVYMSQNLLEMRSITKEFPGVKALDNVTVEVKQGSIHALVGENGAGKSTLMNVLSGVYPYGSYTGDILFDGEVCEFKDINSSEAKGIVIIHQELALSPYMTIAENIFLGNERQSKGIMNWEETNEKAKKLMDQVGLSLPYDRKIIDIGVGHQQLVEIAKALSKDVKLLILDEPTAALNDDDSSHLLDLLETLNREQGITCIIISHKLNEVTRIAHEITIIRDGMTIETLNKERDVISEDRIIKGMVGRELVDRYPKREPNIGQVTFSVENWTVKDAMDPSKYRLKDIAFNVRKGEVVGIAGLMGAGRTELAMSIFGQSYGSGVMGTITKDGQTIELPDVKTAIDNGLAYLAEDRKEAGLILIDHIMHNISMAHLSAVSRNGVIMDEEEREVAETYRKMLQIKTPSVLQKTGNLSGGNQQKVCLAKWLFSQPDVLFLDEPTRGIDVGAKYEIYKLINDMADEGKSVVVISSELPELLGICDRIYVMNEGRIVGELPIEEANQESIMQCIIHNGR